MERTPAVVPKGGEIAVLSDLFPILNAQSALEIRSLIAENTGAGGIAETDFERITVPGGGGTQFTFQTLDGEEHFKDLNGIIVGWRDIRLRYSKPYGQGKNMPPDCSSKDGFWGVGDPGGDCGQCPFAEYGSDPKGGRGQACKQVRQLLFLRDGQILPNLVNVPPTSRKNVQNYFLRLSSARRHYWSLVTNIRLERVTNPDNVPYSRMLFSAGTRLSQEESDTLRPFAEQMGSMLKPLVVETEDYSIQEDDNQQQPPTE